MFGFLLSSHASAQETGRISFWDDPVNHPLTPLYVVSALVLIAILTALVVAIYLLKIFNILFEQPEDEKAVRPYAKRESWWNKFLNQLNNSVPVAREEEIDMGHSYDGIRELDNHLPPWWKWLFYGTIAWSVVYLVVYHVTNSMPLSREEYQEEVALAATQIQALRASQPQAEIDESALVYSNDAAIIAKGQELFMDYNCGSCHRNDGGGNTIGPNLTDPYWLHGGNIKDIFATITNGVVEKGMPAWGNAMSPESVRDLSFFVMSLNGTTPVDPKAPQGKLHEPQPESTIDSSNVQVMRND